jgi:creatinine amidohydrolase
MRYRPSRYVGARTASEIAAGASERSILLLPLGSFEQHGPHLPLNTDTIIADYFANAILRRLARRYDFWLLPTMPYGVAYEHSWSQGTVSLSSGLFYNLVLNVCEKTAKSFGTTNILIINGHGGNRGLLEALAREAYNRAKLNICVTQPLALGRNSSRYRIPDIHGGIGETSMMLFIAKGEVRLNSIPKMRMAAQRRNIQNLILSRGVDWPWTSDDPSISVEGIIGDPGKASASLGARIAAKALKEYDSILPLLLKRSSGL